MSTDNFAQSMQQAEQSPLLQQKLAATPNQAQATKAEGLDSMTGELEESELEAVSGGLGYYDVFGLLAGEDVPRGF